MPIVSKEQVLNLIKPLFAKRNDLSNKKDFGHGLVIGGSYNYVGAPQFSAEANEETMIQMSNNLIGNGESAMMTGLGTSGLVLPDFLAKYVHPNLRYSALYPIDSDGKYIKFNKEQIETYCKKANAVAIGMGMSEGESQKIVRYLLDETNVSLIIDADALVKCKDFDFKDRAILTPHLGEMSRMIDIPVDEIQQNQERTCLEYAKEHHCVLVLKNFATSISNGYTCMTMHFGNSKLAKGGSGDVLSGIILGIVGSHIKSKNSDNVEDFMANYEMLEKRRKSLMLSAVAGSYILGRCAEISNVNEFSHKPDDIIKNIEKVIDEIIAY